MNGLAEFLVESILVEAAKIDKVVVVYSGRFQPFHKGHYATYEQLVKKFGADNVYIATSNVTDSSKSPFNFREKKSIMTKMFGIPSSKIIQTKNPYAPSEVLNKYNSETTGYVAVVGEKDDARLGGKYFTPYKGKVEQGYLDKGYVYAAPGVSNPISGTDVRGWLSKGTDAERKKNFMKAYPKFDEQIYKLITLKLRGFNESLYQANKEIITEFGFGGGAAAPTGGLPGGAFTGLVSTAGYINGSPDPKDVKKTAKKLKKKGDDQYEPVEEDVNVDVDKGDEILMGKFKNKKVVVKDIGKDEHGMPTINGKQATTFRTTKENTDIIPGGLAKGKTLIDLAKKWDPKGYYDPKQFAAEYIKKKLQQGIKVEMEHTTDIRIAAEIAMDHLWEDIRYYDKLKEECLLEYTGADAFYNDGNTVTGYQWNADWDDYDNAKYYTQDLPGWSHYHEKPSEHELKRLKNQSKLPIDNHDDSTHKYNRILKTGIQRPDEWLEANKNPNTPNKDVSGNTDNIPNQYNNDTNTDERINMDPTIDIDGEVIKDEERHIAKSVKLKFPVIKESILNEGGAYGHMNHPFDISMNLTFGDLKNIVVRALNGDLELAREKTDGQALAISWVNGRLVAARNKSHTKHKGAGAMSIGDVAKQFAGRGALTDAYTFAMNDLSKAISSLSDAQKKKIFKDGACFMNLEVIYPKNSNVIPYGQNLLVFHNTYEYDNEGNVIGSNQEAAKILAGMIKQVNKHVQDTYTIQGPPMQSLPKSDDLSKKQGKYIGMINKLQGEFGLKDSDGVADYHQAWWANFVDKGAKNLDAQQKIGLVKRWAFGDKSFRLADIKDTKIKAWADQTDKKDQVKISKDNLMKFEEIFLGVGADVLSFMQSVLTANPQDATKQLRAELGNAIKQIKATGTASQLDKLKIELARLNAIGGFDKIVPNEGIVFVYGGNTYKLTGAFAPLNQILGIFKYGR